MMNVLAWGAADRGFEPRPDEAKDYHLYLLFLR